MRTRHVALVLAGLTSTVSGQSLLEEVHRTFPWSERAGNSFVVADFDGDSHADLVLLSSQTETRIAFWSGNGTGKWTHDSRGRFPTDDVHGSAVRHGDLDGDGDPDLLVLGRDSSWLWLNDGSGRFQDVTATHLPFDLFASLDVLIADVNGDSLLDLYWLKTTTLGGQNRLSLGIGFGRFRDATNTNLPALRDDTNTAAFGDVDGDSDLDIYVANRSTNRLYLNDGTGVFTDVTATHLPVFQASTLAVSLVDVDGDADLDVFTVADGDPELFENDGTAHFTRISTTNLPPLPASYRSCALGDLDGDGDPDAVLGSGNGIFSLNRPTLLRNDGSGVFSDGTPTPFLNDDRPMSRIELLDLDGDSDLDVLIGDALVPLRSYRNDGSGTLYPGERDDIPMPIVEVVDLAVSDLNGDGATDLVWTDGKTEGTLLGDFTGRFHVYARSPFGTRTNFSSAILRVADFDGDGTQDVFFVTTQSGAQPVLYTNDGSANFSPSPFTVPSWPGSSALIELEVADVDRDGDADVVALGRNLMQTYRNDGTGRFTLVPAFPPIAFSLYADFTLFDLEGDGDLDVALGRDSGRGLLFRNDGSGNFTDPGLTSPPFSTSTTAVAALDFDGDGDVDLVGTTNDGRNPRAWTNAGNLLFLETTFFIPVIDDEVREIVPFDLEGDGDQDLFFATKDARNRLLLNDGTGSFFDASSLIPEDQGDATNARVVDVDDDQDLDLLLTYPARGAKPQLLRNMHRQLAYTSPPRVGRDLVMEVRGTFGAAASIGVSTAQTALSLPALGTFRLSPAGLVLIPGVRLDGFGRHRVRVTIPNDPSLVNSSLYWQAFLSDPLGFTNLEITTFAGY